MILEAFKLGLDLAQRSQGATVAYSAQGFNSAVNDVNEFIS